MKITTTKLPSLKTCERRAQDAFNAWIRWRDREKGCISCPRGQPEQAGHFFSAGHFTAVRFNEINVNGQCVRCNCFLHGNLLAYKEGLIRRYGPEKVLMLENAAALRKVHKYSRFEFEIIRKEYERKLREEEL